MKASEKKTLLSHIKKDDKEFRAQIKDDIKESPGALHSVLFDFAFLKGLLYAY